MALPRDTTGLSAVCDCDITWSYSLTFLSEIVWSIEQKLDIKTS